MLRMLLVAVAAAVLLLATRAQAGTEPGVAAALRERVEQLAATGRVDVGGVALGRDSLLAGFYARRSYQPAWTDPRRVAEFLLLLDGSGEYGLDRRDFFLPALREVPADAVATAERDMLLTEALVRYGYQRRFGKVNPLQLEPAWNFARGFADGADPVTLLETAVAAPSLAAFLDERIPEGPWYEQLRRALQRYRGLAAAGGWAPVPAGPALRPGDRDARVAALRQRLQAEGLADASAPDAEVFDDALADAVRRFQERYSLGADGVVGTRTLQQLNVPVEDRVDQLRMSLERVRWLSGESPSTYVVVNVAGFRVGFVRDNRLVWNSRVVVGREARQTPVFRDEITYIELNPTWTVPPTILREDILPKVRRDPAYLRRENISVIDASGNKVDPFSVDWASYRRSVPYTLRQEPGPANALGRIKLMFPNPYSVYLHDTPAKALFDKPDRTFSSGCIRVEDPLALAELVLADPAWTRETLESAIAAGATRRIRLKQPVPVFLVYLTAIADPDGSARFFRDVYQRDDALLRALNGPVRIELPPAKAAARAGELRPAPL